MPSKIRTANFPNITEQQMGRTIRKPNDLRSALLSKSSPISSTVYTSIYMYVCIQEPENERRGKKGRNSVAPHYRLPLSLRMNNNGISMMLSGVFKI